MKRKTQAAARRPGFLSRASAAARFLAFGGVYDFQTRGTNPGGGRIRRAPNPERKEEEALALPWERNTGVALVRDLLRNAPQARGLAKTLRVNTVGPLGKLVFRADGDWFAAAAKYFNDTWGRHADFVDGSTWRESLQLAISAVAFEGDFVAVFDDGALSGGAGTGRVAFFESDQICNLAAADFAPYAARGLSQVSGVIFDKLGRKCGVIVSRERGLNETRAENALVLACDPDDPDAAPWRHVSRKFRLRQLRGTPEAFAAAPVIADNHEMFEMERIAAKQNSSRPATVLMETPDEADDEGLDVNPGATLSKLAAADAATDAATDSAAAENDGPALPALEKSGVGVDYVEGVRDIKYKDPSTPNSNLEPFIKFGMDMAGMALGIGHSQATFRTDSSYTAFRGDLAMTWATFADNQQFIEDAFSDWIAAKAIAHGVAVGALDPPPVEDWAASIAWIYPHAPSVDETKSVAAFRDGIASGMTTFQDRFGPNWRAHLQQLADEQAEIARLGLRLSQWPASGGGFADPAAPSAPDNLSGEGGSRRDDDWEPVDENEAREALDEFDNEEGENGK